MTYQLSRQWPEVPGADRHLCACPEKFGGEGGGTNPLTSARDQCRLAGEAEQIRHPSSLHSEAARRVAGGTPQPSTQRSAKVVHSHGGPNLFESAGSGVHRTDSPVEQHSVQEIGVGQQFAAALSQAAQ
jgi:hypothetical protein